MGRFGLDINRYVTDLVSADTFEKIATTREISTEKYITDNDILVSYYPNLDQ